MFYVLRDDEQKIYAVYSTPTSEATECLPPSHHEVLAFFSGQESANTSTLDLTLSDLKMVRVIEDLVDILIDKSVVSLDDFPADAKARLQMRKQVRTQLSKPS